MDDTLNVGDRIRLIFADAPNQTEEAVVCSTLSNQQEGLGPEIGDYVACWLEVSLASCSDVSSRRSISLGTDFAYSMDGRKLQIEKLKA